MYCTNANIVFRSQQRQQVVLLKDKTDSGLTKVCPLLIGHGRQIASIDPHVP